MHTKTIAYVLTVPAASMEPGVKAHTPASAADALVAMVQAAISMNLYAVELTGSHTDDTTGSVRFRMADDKAATDFATWLVGDAPGATLHSGFGVNKHLVAQS
jgi:hypothetical protein